MKKIKSLRSAGLVAGVLAGLALMTAPAQAYPESCSTGWASDNNAYGNCSAGTGQYRIGIPCKNIFTAWHQYSGWKSVGVPASVGCPFGSSVWRDIPGGPQILVEKRN